jgi:hypothetical protein
MKKIEQKQAIRESDLALKRIWFKFHGKPKFKAKWPMFF